MLLGGSSDAKQNFGLACIIGSNVINRGLAFAERLSEYCLLDLRCASPSDLVRPIASSFDQISAHLVILIQCHVCQLYILVRTLGLMCTCGSQGVQTLPMLQQLGAQLEQAVPKRATQSNLQANIAQAEALILAERDFQLPLMNPEDGPTEAPALASGMRPARLQQLDAAGFEDMPQPGLRGHHSMSGSDLQQQLHDPQVGVDEHE